MPSSGLEQKPPSVTTSSIRTSPSTEPETNTCDHEAVVPTIVGAA